MINWNVNLRMLTCSFDQNMMKWMKRMQKHFYFSFSVAKSDQTDQLEEAQSVFFTIQFYKNVAVRRPLLSVYHFKGIYANEIGIMIMTLLYLELHAGESRDAVPWTQLRLSAALLLSPVILAQHPGQGRETTVFHHRILRKGDCFFKQWGTETTSMTSCSKVSGRETPHRPPCLALPSKESG